MRIEVHEAGCSPITLIVLSTLVLHRLQRYGVADTTKVAAAPPVARITVATQPAPEDGMFVASGPIVVENQVDVAALREGVIDAILAEPNTHVRKGQLLARLDDRQISADLDAASAKTRSIKADLKNWEAETKVLESENSFAHGSDLIQALSFPPPSFSGWPGWSGSWRLRRRGRRKSGGRRDVRAAGPCAREYSAQPEWKR